MSWLQSTLSRAAQHPSVTSALDRARWHRKESEDFLRHSVQAMYQHERDAVHLASTAQRLQHELLMQEGMTAGVWQAYAVKHCPTRGTCIQVYTRGVWLKGYIWSEKPQPDDALPFTLPRRLNGEGRCTQGMPITAGDVFETLSGRITTPFPKGKKENSASVWLIENAYVEADARGDAFNAKAFAACSPLRDGSLAPADRDGMLSYLFEWQPTVPQRLLSPLTSAH